MSYDLSANPLHLPLPVGRDSLQYAAGASVGNAVFSCVIGAVLHLIATLQRRCATAALQSRQSSLLTALVSMLPSSLLLGSLAIPYGTLGQPAISACVGLLLSVHRTPQSVACGVVMLLCFWLAFPIACAYLVLAGRGRRNSMFVLQSTSVVVATSGKVNNRLTRLRHMHQYLLSPRTEWRLHPGCSKRGTPERRYAEFLLENMEAVFGAYVGGREWYFVVEWGVLVVSAAVLGAAEITAIDDAGSACVAAQWGIGTVLALSAVQVVLCVWLRPFTVRAEFYVSVLLGTMSVVCQALALAGDVDASAQVDSTAAIVAIVVLVLFMLSGVRMRIRRRHSVLAADNADPSMNEVTSARQRSMRTHQQLCVIDNQWTAAPPAGQLDQLTTLVALVCEQSRKHNECLVGCRRR